jgi:hypothetical protein
MFVREVLSVHVQRVEIITVRALIYLVTSDEALHIHAWFKC